NVTARSGRAGERRPSATGSATAAARRIPSAETSRVTRAPRRSSGRLSITTRRSKPTGRLRPLLHQGRDGRRLHLEAAPLHLQLPHRPVLLQLEDLGAQVVGQILVLYARGPGEVGPVAELAGELVLARLLLHEPGQVGQPVRRRVDPAVVDVGVDLGEADVLA